MGNVSAAHAQPASKMRPNRELPLVLLERIIRQARTRKIPGSNRYARVCRQWRDAYNSSDDEVQLQLFLDKRLADEADVSQLSSWMSMYGQHLGVLVAGPIQPGPEQLDWLPGPAAALRCLTRLEVVQRDSLALLAPVLGQLPQLQHLAARVGLTWCDDSDSASDMSGMIDKGVFCHHVWQQKTDRWAHGPSHWEPIPNFQQLCPQLVRLHLTLEPECEDLEVDSRLHRLLPTGLQQLSLSNADDCEMWLGSSMLRLEHHTALQQLVLSGVQLTQHEAACLLERVRKYQRPGQQLQVHVCDTSISSGALQQLAPLLTDLHTYDATDVQLVAGLAPLTRLAVDDSGENVIAGVAHVVSSLTGLQELVLEGGNWDWSYMWQVVRMPTLRSLTIQSRDQPPEYLGSDLEACTQLTALELLLPLPAEPWGSDDEDESSDEESYGQNWVPALQGLTALQCLTVPAEAVPWRQGAWLAELTSLSRLSVNLPDFYQHCGLLKAGPDGTIRGVSPTVAEVVQCNRRNVRRLLGRVREWPASLEFVVFWMAPLGPTHCGGDAMVPPMCWEHTTAGPVSRQLKVWLELPACGAAQGWPRPFQPCPHLRGVWELQAPGAGS
jgi:hypothetical protein